MQKNNIILLDEFDYYKAKQDHDSANFVRSAALTPILMTNIEGKTIIQNSLLGNQPISGTILTASQINPNKYYDIHSEKLIKRLRKDFFEILLKYGPMFGASEIEINYIENTEVNEKQSDKKQTHVEGKGSHEGIDVKGDFSNQSDQNNAKAEKRKNETLKGQVTNSSLKKNNVQEIIKCLEEDGINYKAIPLLDRMVCNFNGLEVIREIISISETVQTSDKLLKTLKSSGSIKHILFSAQFNTDYLSEINHNLETFQSTSLAILIKFHPVKKSNKVIEWLKS